ncbi:MAG: hypothetical protein K2I89_09355 [Muribaculaceae bacterium]|nr:hypothetical protein [Muribaculaceae bacterium]
MNTISYNEVVNLLDRIIETPNCITRPLFIIGETLSVTDRLKSYIEQQAGAKSLNSFTVLYIGDFLDNEGKLVPDISSRTQRLADGGACNALVYVQTVANQYNQKDYRLLYHRQWQFSPNWSAADRYVANQVSKPLVIILDPGYDFDEFLDFEFIKCLDD